MAGFGGVPKLSTQQQDSAIGDLSPALLSCDRLVALCKEHEGNDVIAGLYAELLRCMADIQKLMMDVEEGHSRLSGLDADDLAFMIEYLVKEVKSLGSKLRGEISLSKGRAKSHG